MLFLVPVFSGAPRTAALRIALSVTGVLSLAGLLGPLLDDMQLRSIGIVGYAGAFLVAALLLARSLHTTPEETP